MVHLVGVNALSSGKGSSDWPASSKDVEKSMPSKAPLLSIFSTIEDALALAKAKK